jgi:glycosyltransferase involved in cell wall biosynthesis
MAFDSAGEPAVSLVVPVFNKAPYLAETIESLLAQSLREIEVICVDDCSTDGSLQILRQFAERDPRVHVLENERNAGAGRSRNRGLLHARGKYVRFIDADDLIPSDTLLTLYRLIVADAVDAVKGNIEGFTETGPDNRWILERPVGEVHAKSLREVPNVWNPWYHVTWLFARELLVGHGVEYPSLRTGEDPVFLARALAVVRTLSTSTEICYRYRIGTPKPYRVLDFRWMMEHAQHAAEVKATFLQGGVEFCWRDSYAGFSLEDLVRMGKNARMSPEERALFSREIRQVYGDWPGWEQAAARLNLEGGTTC